LKKNIAVIGGGAAGMMAAYAAGERTGDGASVLEAKKRVRVGVYALDPKEYDGERVLVKITSVNLAGNILPFEKEVYSEDAMEGIYVPGNAKAETIKEAEAAGVSGTNTSISGGLDMGSQIVAGAANSVINATKSAASKNIRKIKVTIKTNYRILLKDAKK